MGLLSVTSLTIYPAFYGLLTRDEWSQNSYSGDVNQWDVYGYFEFLTDIKYFRDSIKILKWVFVYCGW